MILYVVFPGDLEFVDINSPPGIKLTWFQSYLKNRSQVVYYNGGKSNVGYFKSGVPQGSVLGPLCFTLFINDLPNSIDSGVHMYADDTTIYSASNKITEIVSKLGPAVNMLEKWSNSNGLPINASKSCFVLFNTKQKLLNINPPCLQLNNITLPLP